MSPSCQPMGGCCTFSLSLSLTSGATRSTFAGMLPIATAKSPETFLCVAGEMFLPTGEGALWWPDRQTLVVSDLHVEKGSDFARRGQLLPPYDTGATLALIETLAAKFQPRMIISLGDSFHDRQAERRLSAQSVRRIRRLTSRYSWYWVEGNHDPEPPAFLGGHGVRSLRLGACVFRHEPTGETGEIAGHLHPVARIAGRGKSLRRKCFVTDGQTMLLPSMGAYTGGLNVLDPAISRIFRDGAMVFAVNGTRVHSVERSRLRPDGGAEKLARMAQRT